jgi:hypothetical protein
MDWNDDLSNFSDSKICRIDRTMRDSTEILLETSLMSALNIAAVYIAAFTYRLNWSGILMVMVVASLITASLTHIILSKFKNINPRNADMKLSEAVGALLIALVSGLAVFIILIDRFDLPSALGISLLSGVLSSLVRHIIA